MSLPFRTVRSRVRLLLAAAALTAACSSGATTVDGGTTTDGPAAPPSPTDVPTSERVEASLWVSPDRSEGVVAFVIEDPIPTGSSGIALSSDLVRRATEVAVTVDGEPRELSGTAFVPWEFGADRRLEVEVAFPLRPSTRWDLAGTMIDEWLPTRVTVPRYLSRVVWDVEVHAPVEAAIGGDPKPACERPAPDGREAATCAASLELGVPPLLYLPAEDEQRRLSEGGYVELIGDLPAGVAEDLVAFADGAVERLNEILGDVAPRRVAAITGDIAGNFAGEALGPMVVLDQGYVQRQPDATRDLLAHELVHTAQEHRLAAPGRDPGSGMTESLAEYLSFRLSLGDDLDAIRDRVRDRGVGQAQTADVEGLAPRDAFGRRPPVGGDHLISTYEYQRRALVYTYLPRSWVDLHAHLGQDRMDRFLRELHTRPGLDWNIDQVFALAAEFGDEAGDILRRYWEQPVPQDQEDW